MMGRLQEILKFILKHKSKLILTVGSTIIFLVLLFPLSDLSNLVGSKVAELTQNQIFIKFDDIKISFLPRPGIEFKKISVDTPQLPTLTANELTVSPSPFSLISKKPAGSISARGIFRGDIDISLSGASRSEAGNERKKIEITADKIQLQDLKEIRQIPLLLKGQLSLKGTVLADLTFTEQPDADIEIHASQFEIPAQTVNTTMGPENIPEMKLGKIELKGKLTAGRLSIESGKIGGDGDDIRGTITGGIAISLKNQGGIAPEFGSYSFDLDISMKKNFEDKLNTGYTALLSQYKTVVGDSSRYTIRISARNPYGPPDLTPLK